MDEMADSAKLDKAIADAHSLQAEHLSCWWSPCDSAERVAADAETLNRAGEKVSAAGLKLCYHNHDQELRNVFDGKRALDLLVEKTQPGKVFFEIDVAWVTFGGGNPVDVIHALGDRVPAIHMKDLASMDERGQFTSVGTGLVDVVASAQAAWDVSAGWIIYEQDRPHRLTGMESAQASYLNMKELGIA
jgi:sugar phosphate isomerase/epimerase